MPTRAQLHRRRSLLTRAWDLHIPAICDQRPANAQRAGMRTEIVASWERSAAHIMPEVREAPLADVDETRLAFQASPLSAAVRQLESQLRAAADDGEFVVAVTDPGARIPWTYGGAVMQRKAEKVNFIQGGRWDEPSVGTNALDLALRLDHAATVYSAEHFSSYVHGWVCWATPVHDPRTGRQLGVLDLSTTWNRSHPIGLVTAEALARLLGREVRATAVAGAPQNGMSHCGGLLELKLLGRASAQLNGVRLRLTRWQIENLALLALNPDGLDLSELHARLYGDRSVSQGTLKAETSQLRAVLGGRLESRPYRIGLDVRCDVTDVRHRLRAHSYSFRPQPSALAQVAHRSQPAVPQQVAEHERHRLARELHDGAIQEVLAAGLAIDLCLADMPAGSPMHATLEHAKRLTATAVRRLRSSLQELREGASRPDEELPDMLRRLKARHPAHLLDVSVEVTGPPVPLTAAVRRSLFQVASECVFNAAVHGRARRTAIRLSYGCGVVALCIADDGRGKPKMLRKIIQGQVPGTGGGYHLGLADIAARAEEMGWTLRADRSDLGGIALQVLLPVQAPGDMQKETDG